MESPVMPFFDQLDWAYSTVDKYMPKFVQDRPMAAAFVYGLAGSSLIMKTVQEFSKRYMPSRFHDSWLPNIEKAAMAALFVVPLAFSIIDPEGTREMMTQNPVYSSGLFGGWLGIMAANAFDLHNRSLEAKLR